MVSVCNIGLEHIHNALDMEDLSAADLLSFARQVACGMVSRCSINGALKYSMIVMRDERIIREIIYALFCRNISRQIV